MEKNWTDYKWKWKCNCGKIFRVRADLLEHRKICKAKQSDETLTCKFCGHLCKNKSGHTIHEKSCIKNPYRVPGSSMGLTYSEEILNTRFRNNPNQGGLREGSGRGKKGWYKGFYCRSTWELAWLIYQLDNNIPVEKCDKYFQYTFEGKSHKYFPDFKIGDEYIEIKGWRLPNVKAKIEQFPKDKKLILIEGKIAMKPYLEYCIQKYGDFVKKYELPS
jgi:hypothetical protein